ncbi:primosomal protein N' [Flavobacteriaceae bacterium]|nr:primosomal protein N' [Flavobacteriaceae bacterium]MDB2672867.1 primosomal protein N' [Flavobacteriaceae bacterium]MDB4187014.1 primosomal protein N' [Flavobacteriaceae bacterium]MDB9823796.1 primosomal protein N' [Flavobacteriaceae bacterium]MDB9886119.1 primosomal protein N' [Flavobacteriaceae bacterium]
MQFFIDVLLPLPLPRAFTYWVNEAEFDFLSPGFRVGVPFGKNKLYTGLVYKKHRVAPQAYTPKTIEVILEDHSIVTPQQLQFWEWMSDYYRCSMGNILRAALPSAFLLTSETSISRVKEIEIDWDGLSDEAYLVLEALEQRDLLIEDIQAIVQRKTVLPLLQTLIEKGYVQTLQSLKEKYKPKKHRYLRIHPDHSTDEALSSLFDQLKRAPKQSAFLLGLYQLKNEEEWVKLSLLKKQLDVTSGLVRILLDKGVIDEQWVQEDRVLLKGMDGDSKPVLSFAQQTALNDIQQQWEEKEVVLLEGVTSSGKTEVYFSLIEEQLKKEKQVLFLLPEISLTAQMVQRLQKRFGEQVTVFHSKFSIHERVEVWKNILHNSPKARIVLGARSAIFLPFKRLGLIVVDEEHESSFKQFDPAPRYQARDAAIVLGNQYKCKLLLGSATPSIESRFNVERKKYGHVQLLERFGEAVLPLVQTIDLKEAHKKKEMKGLFSKVLFEQIENNLLEGKQIILFQNRRGYAPLLECHTCGHIPQCTNCDVSLTYHQYNHQLRCHYCGYHIAKPIQCVVCSGPSLELKGTGTQQIEEQVQQYFPQAKVERMDWDSTRGKWSFESIIERFTTGEVNILVGTQMVTKGLDFKNVGLVGVINADPLLFFPDFRAHERAFQLLTQVAGRAGRSSEQGKVLIQSFSPAHPVLQQVIQTNYEALYTQQIHERRTFDYPPFFRLIRISLKARDYQKAQQAAQWLHDVLAQHLTTPILGPVDPVVARVRNQYIKQLLLKYPDNTSRKHIKDVLSNALKSIEAIGQFRSVKINIDVDPF